MEKTEPCAATVGFFDGVHRGHRFLIEQVKQLARERQLASTLITFPVSPRQVLQPGFRTALLSTAKEKERLLRATGVSRCRMLPFTLALSRLSARRFMQEVLQERFGVSLLVIGYDHRFGYRRSEGFEDYCRIGRETGMEVVQARAYAEDGTQVSSSAIRTRLEQGDVKGAARLLGYRYGMEGKVVDGHKIGRTLGFPTANLTVACPDKLIPADGVYAVTVTIGERDYAGMLNIGCRPTLDNGAERTVEVHLLHFDGDLYGQTLRVTFVERMRDEQKFGGQDELAAALERDADAAERIVRESPLSI